LHKTTTYVLWILRDRVNVAILSLVVYNCFFVLEHSKYESIDSFYYVLGHFLTLQVPMYDIYSMANYFVFAYV